MAEAPAQKRKHDKASGARKRRRVRSSLEGAPSESASSLGNVAIFTDVWGWRVRPGGRHDGKEGDDYLLGELAVLRYIEDMRTNEVAAEEATQSTDEGGAGVRAVGQAVVTEHHDHRTSDQEARSTSRAAGAVGDGSEAWGDVGAGEIVVAGTRGRGTRRGRGESKLCEELQVASVRWETTVLVAVVFSTKKLLWSAVHEDEVVVRVVAQEWTLVVTSLQVTVPLSPR
ncbi:hypothetical protein PC128_g22131 [Phytophthora cactorum]|nr:hypothetical protein PC128_g22131 [Phytophthora cactorum]